MVLLLKSILLFIAGSLLQSLPAEGSIYTKPHSQVDTAKVSEKRIDYKLKKVNEIVNSDIKQAMTSAKEALADATTLNNKFLIGESKLAMGICYDYLGAYIEALEQSKGALSIFEELKDYREMSSTFMQIGNIYYYSREFVLAMDNYKRAYYYGKQLNDTLLMIQGIIGRGSVYGNTNRMDSAMILFKESYNRAKEFGDKTTEVKSLFYLGDVYLYSYSPQKALEVYQLVEKNYDLHRINSRLVAGLLNSITNAYIRTGKIDSARYYSRRSWNIIEKDSRLNQKTAFFLNKFRIDSLGGDYLSAIEDFRAYKKLSDSINNSALKKSLANSEIVNELRKKESEISRLKIENELKDLNIKQRKIVNFGSIALVFLLFVIIFQTVRIGRKIRYKNDILQTQGEELATANEELTAINDTLVSQREELEEAMVNLKNTQEQLIQSEKMSSLGVLASGVAHEINNSLNYIKGGVRGIIDQLKMNQNCRESDIEFLVYAVNSGIEKAVAVVSGLDHFSRNENSAITELDIHKVIDTCLELLKYMTHNRIEIIKEYSEKPCIVTCNEGKLHQAYMNILLNAIQAIDCSGTISIRTEHGNGKIKAYFNDTGCGINENDMNKILEPFFTTRDPGKGVGLGLYITYSILKEQNGSIDFKSVEGKGTTVIVTLPCHN